MCWVLFFFLAKRPMVVIFLQVNMFTSHTRCTDLRVPTTYIFFKKRANFELDKLLSGAMNALKKKKKKKKKKTFSKIIITPIGKNNHIILCMKRYIQVNT